MPSLLVAKCCSQTKPSALNIAGFDRSFVVTVHPFSALLTYMAPSFSVKGRI